MHAVRVGDEWLPWSTSGHPALESCNTYAGWGWLRSYATLAVRTGHSDLADDQDVGRLPHQGRRRPAAAAAALGRPGRSAPTCTPA
ncbi:hypothetical protein ACFU5O_09215 [Streptomyces sp. NPDC057445]|uniref:hypothetical protein n=1 Tax=Streptomyces sp. NPDC057445 TaxID=3346136 RepID=UPI00367D3256